MKISRAAAVKAAAAAVLLLLGGLAAHLRSGLPPADVLRRLSGLRLALELYRQEKKALPATYAAVIEAGKLEAVPEVKLPWHRASAAVRDAASAELRDTGGWAYVNDPASPDFGLVFLDCSHRDPKGRAWSEF